MSTRPAVSVLMTAYNRERYIAASIESVLRQSFADFELLIVDDQSQDRTVEIANAYAASDRRVRVTVNAQNVGDYPNRNRAARLARGRYLKYHDSDDVMYPHCLEVMVSRLDEEPRASFALSAASAWPGGPVPMLHSPMQCYQREFLGFGMFMCGPACALFRAEAFEELGGFPEEGAHSDHLFWLKACARRHVLLLSADLFWYRTHAAQELASPAAPRDYARVPGAVWNALGSAECPLHGEELEQARRNHVWGLAKQTWRDIKAGQFGLAIYRLRKSGTTLVDMARYLRPQRRHAMAGIALDEDGDAIVPACLASPIAREP
jgi:glycosyltransferase involved in cell wall biosynthesis